MKLGDRMTPEHREAIRQGLAASSKRLGRPPGIPLSDEEKERRRIASTGRRHTPESRAKMSEAQRGHHRGIGHAVSDETRAKIAAALTGKKRDQEVVEAHARKMTGRKYPQWQGIDRFRGGLGRPPVEIENHYARLLAPVGFVHGYRVSCGGYDGRYCLDLAHPTLKIDVELDGPSHRGPRRRAHDKKRDEALRSRGWIVLRIPYGRSPARAHSASQ